MTTLKFDHKDNGSLVEARRGDVIIISLHETPSTGYRWKVENIDQEVLQFQKADFLLDPRAGIGGGGIRNFTFQAIQKGTTNLFLKLLRSWLGDVSIIKRYEISIKIL